MSINIFGVVGKEVRAADTIAKIQAEKGKIIDVNIMSIGGDVREGLAIYDSLREAAANGQEIKTFALGMTASIASIIFMAGDERKVSDNAELMVHNASVDMYGNKHELRGAIEFLDDIDDKLINIYTDRTDLSKKEVSSLLDQETFMTADEAVNKGFATEKSSALELVAQYNKSINKTKEPVKMATEEETKETGFINYVKAYFKSEAKAEDEEEKKEMPEEAKAEEVEEEVFEEEAKAESEEIDVEALQAELAALKAEKAEAVETVEASAKADNEKRALIFSAMSSNKILLSDAEKLSNESLENVKSHLEGVGENATKRGSNGEPEKGSDVSAFEHYKAIKDPQKRSAYMKDNKAAVIASDPVNIK